MIQHHIGHASTKKTSDVYGQRLTRGDEPRLKALDERLPGGDSEKACLSGKRKKAAKRSMWSASPLIDGLREARPRSQRVCGATDAVRGLLHGFGGRTHQLSRCLHSWGCLDGRLIP